MKWRFRCERANEKAQRLRKAIHDAAKDVGCDFPGLGPHSFRRANITWQQEVGGSAIEASKIAGHSEVDMTGAYTFVGIDRQESGGADARHPGAVAQAAPQDGGPSPNDPQREQVAGARRVKQEKAKVVAINAKESAA